MSLIHALSDAVALAPMAPTPTPGTGWDAPPASPPGMETILPEWVGWAKYIAIGAGILGLIACGVMMMVGRRNRSHLSAEGASGLLWVLGGLSVVTLAAGVVPAIVT
ncbi:hypothetical protein [Streptomyces sp. IB2014 011-1]|uniref:hypothetical protein n=1 Tax=Streptomyces sp. IB2014 011-1 TaxID=1844478 RepID=UPI0009C735BB|nr:hypothetical protein [Streptomyces sp. IB2014 011-1]ONI48500.1 TrbC/VIRB2 family protein [Streptomyces sp. IB2014 011-1]